jgi:uncharacterized protein (DUF2249 family)/quercetin dioxygenase-like cupin family protein
MRVSGPVDAPLRVAPRAAGLKARVLAGAESAPESRAGLVEIEVAPGRSLPLRAPAGGDALVYVVFGRGRLLGEDGAVDGVGGSAVHIGGGARVAITNVGMGTLRLLAVYSPAGSEHGFLSWGEDAGDEDEEIRAWLDLTRLPRPQRHRTVIAALEALEPGTPLVVVNDHEPAGLRRQLERRYDARLGWDVRDRRPDRVAVAIWLEGPGDPVPLSRAARVAGGLSPSAA